MIYLLTGKKELQKKAILEICEQQNLDASSMQHFYTDDFSDISFEQKIPVNTGLFGERECFVFHNLVRDVMNKTLLKKYVETEHLLIFSEETILKKDREVFENLGASIQEFAKEIKEEEKKFNTFVLADFFGGRDRKNLWLKFREAKNAGVSNEEIQGLLFWELKTLALVKKNDVSAMNDFVLRKNQSYAQKWTLEEIQDYAQKLTEMYHMRDSYSTLEIELEKMILGL